MTARQIARILTTRDSIANIVTVAGADEAPTRIGAMRICRQAIVRSESAFVYVAAIGQGVPSGAAARKASRRVGARSIGGTRTCSVAFVNVDAILGQERAIGPLVARNAIACVVGTKGDVWTCACARG